MIECILMTKMVLNKQFEIKTKQKNLLIIAQVVFDICVNEAKNILTKYAV